MNITDLSKQYLNFAFSNYAYSAWKYNTSYVAKGRKPSKISFQIVCN